jgi:hypothetical protein
MTAPGTGARRSGPGEAGAGRPWVRLGIALFAVAFWTARRLR